MRPSEPLPTDPVFAAVARALAREGGFVKMHGAGNDFVIIDGRARRFHATRAQIAAICDRHRGVGGDQLLVLEPGGTECDLRLRIYNIDGQEAATCLNATRCAAWIILSEAGVASVRIGTDGGLIEACHAGPMQITLRQPAPRFEWQSVPLAAPRDTLALGLTAGPLTARAALSMGNPHLTCFVPDLDAIDVPRWADQLQKHPLLPEGANIGVAQILSPLAMRLVVWERPGILTQACGSGACAGFAVARRLGLITAVRAEVAMPGGVLHVEETPDGALLLTGPVALAFCGDLS